MNEAKIVSERLAPAHEGDVGMIIDIRHEHGGLSQVPLDHFATQALLIACAAEVADDLIGHTWSKVRDALQISFGRY